MFRRQTRKQPIVRRPVTTSPGLSIPNTPNRGENTGIKNPNAEGDENYVPSKVQPVAQKSSVEYLPGQNGEKYPVGISRNSGPVMPSFKMPEQTPQEIATSKAKLAEKQRMNPGASQTPIGSPMGSPMGMKKGGAVKSKGIDGIAQRGKTKGRYL